MKSFIKNLVFLALAITALVIGADNVGPSDNATGIVIVAMILMLGITVVEALAAKMTATDRQMAQDRIASEQRVAEIRERGKTERARFSR